jgi:hypothetical protein
MKIFTCKSLVLGIIYGICSLSHSQVSTSDIKQDPKIDSLLNKKISFDRERYLNEYFTLQLYYGTSFAFPCRINFGLSGLKASLLR